VGLFLGHEGENSLLSLLMDEGLACSATFYEYDYMNLFSVIGLKIELTEEGFEWHEDVVRIIY
jgi:insulysin